MSTHVHTVESRIPYKGAKQYGCREECRCGAWRLAGKSLTTDWRAPTVKRGGKGGGR